MMASKVFGEYSALDQALLLFRRGEKFYLSLPDAMEGEPYVKIIFDLLDPYKTKHRSYDAWDPPESVWRSVVRCCPPNQILSR